MYKEEDSIRGVYSPSYLSMYIDGDYNGSLDNMSQKDLGTFLHEYVHYVQNISTIRELRGSSLFYKCLQKIIEYIVTSEDGSVTLPITILDEDPDFKRLQSNFNETRGDKIEIREDSFNSVDYSIEKRNNDLYESVYLHFIKDGEVIQSKKLGVLAIKENMAHLCQLYIDPDVTPATLTYKAVELLAERINPTLLDDKLKIIALSLLSLSALNSSKMLVELMEKSKNDDNLSAIELYNKYLGDCRLTLTDGTKLKIEDAFNDSVDLFKKELTTVQVSDPAYTETLANNIKLTYKQDTHPLLMMLEGIKSKEENSTFYIERLIELYGIPVVRDKNGNVVYPANQDKISEVAIELLVFSAMFAKLLNPDDNNGICRLKPICEKNEEYDDENCYQTPWLKDWKHCPFIQAANFFKLKDKIKIERVQ